LSLRTARHPGIEIAPLFIRLVRIVFRVRSQLATWTTRILKQIDRGDKLELSEIGGKNKGIFSLEDLRPRPLSVAFDNKIIFVQSEGYRVWTGVEKDL